MNENQQRLFAYANKAKEEADRFALMGDAHSACMWVDEYAIRYKAYINSLFE